MAAEYTITDETDEHVWVYDTESDTWICDEVGYSTAAMIELGWIRIDTKGEPVS